MIRTTLALAALTSVFALPASAVTVESFIPGASPCAGVCSQEWAADLAGVPMGEPEPVTICPGDMIIWMSYGKDGVAEGGSASMVVGTESPLTGVGYTFTRDGQELLFIRIDACQNWAIVVLGANAGVTGGHAIAEMSFDSPAQPRAVSASSNSFSGGSSSFTGGSFSSSGGFSSSSFVNNSVDESSTNLVSKTMIVDRVRSKRPGPGRGNDVPVVPTPDPMLLLIAAMGILGITSVRT